MIFFKQYEKFTKVTCSSSNKTCINPKCNLKAYSKSVVTMNFNCEMSRTLTNLKLHATTWLRSITGSYRQVINIDNIDVCHTLEGIHDIHPYFKSGAEWINQSFPGLVHKCPYNASKSFQHFRSYVHTIFTQSFNFVNASLKALNHSRSWSPMPNGRMKVRYKGYDDEDDNIVELIFYFEIKYENNYFDFK